ncbi:zinc-binding alcohol dehydrogenase family protein [Niabella hirudinis]|uniref:zinc-binding alcohol dehydrogenase family protein n=1 Tax=Niabella hirudinis TaxID=1285929 RepID=UPI003EBF2310
MRAIKIFGEGNIGLVEKDAPQLGAEEILIKTRYVGFCGSDLNTFRGLNPMVKLPVIPGHEIGGVIEALGKNVPPEFRIGVACTVNPYTHCGNCASCRRGRFNACRYNETFGVQRNGAMCDYIAVPWQKVLMDPELSPKDFALVEPMSIGFHAVSRAGVSDSDCVLVLGCGMIGVGAIVRSALRGAKVIAADLDDDKLALAKQLGAAYTINTGTENVHGRLTELTKDMGPDVIIEAVGLPATYQMAVNEVAFSGRVVCIGYAKPDVSFTTKYFVMKEIDIRGSRNAEPEDFRAVIEYMKRNDWPKEKLISAVVRPEAAREALEKWNAGPGKVFRILVDFEI